MDPAVLSIIIIAITIVSFMLEKIPLALTSLFAALAMGIFGVMPLSEIYAGFGSTTFALSMGMMIVGDAVFETGLAAWFGQRLVRMGIANNERIFLGVMMLIVGIMSAFMSNIATMAMFIPLVSSVAASSKGKINSKYIILPLGLATTIGGSATLVGTTTQQVAQGILNASGYSMSFFELGYIAFPMLVILILYMVTIGYSIMKRNYNFESPLEKNVIVDEEDKDIILTTKMKIAGITLILCIVGFISGIWNIGVVALLGAGVVMVTRCKDYKRAFAELDWNTLVILATSVGFATGLDVSGGGAMIAEFVIGLFGGESASPLLLLAAGVIIATFLTNFASNTATAAMLTPIYINIALQFGIHPLAFVIPVVVACNNATFTPVGTSAVTMTLQAGYRYNDYVKVGFPIAMIMMVMNIILPFFIYSLI